VIPDPAVVQAMVEAVVGSGMAISGAWAARRERQSEDRQADNWACRITGNHALGLPYVPSASTPAPAAADGGASERECHGRLTRHRDGHLTCHGGRWDCQPTSGRWRHGPVVDCSTIDHGCGICDPVLGMGVTPDPPQPEDTACTRGCGRPGTELIAASGSMPTLVCKRCAAAIAAGWVAHLRERGVA